MKNRSVVFLLTPFIILTLLSAGYAQVEWTLQGTLQTEKEPLDVSVSRNGSWVFVLIEQGELLIYAPNGKLKGRISVGKSVDAVEAGPRDDILILRSRKEKSVKIITLDFVQEINVLGSPFKGPTDAPVVIAVFSDFQ